MNSDESLRGSYLWHVIKMRIGRFGEDVTAICVAGPIDTSVRFLNSLFACKGIKIFKFDLAGNHATVPVANERLKKS